ncbi:scarecrow-like protein 21 [Silene latifolia]|uniref:scarecrow-like protein 21 n=1 Tax=Silene latifolia TaxID=37657 RepID=UPI003D7755A0
METIEKNEDLLSLTLATVSYSNHVERKLKRKRNDSVTTALGTSGKDYEGKIIRLLHERRRMLSSKQKGKASVQDGSGLHLIHLLLVSATLINEKNASSAVDNLTELYRYVSVKGDSGERVAAYFADGLTARLLTPKSPFYSMVMSKPTARDEFLAFTHLYKVSPFYQFSHFTANQAILEAFEREQGINNWSLHVIDFDISHGFQWPSLIQSLSEKASEADRSVSFRITGIGKTLEELTDTENRLVSFCKGFQNIVFEFHGLVRGSKIVNLQRRDSETVAVNLVFYLSSLTDIVNISETLSNVHLLKPSILILAEREGSRNNCGVLSNYIDALHYHAAMFDSLDDCLPLESVERVSIEKNHLGREIKEAVGGDEVVKCSRFEMLETWKGRMESHGFKGMELSSKVNIQAKLLLKMGSHYHRGFEGECGGGGGFTVYERDNGRAVSLGWQDRILVTVSSWCCSSY